MKNRYGMIIKLYSSHSEFVTSRYKLCVLCYKSINTRVLTAIVLKLSTQ